MASRGGVSGTLIGLVFSLFLFFIATALAVLFYTQAASATQAAAQAEEELDNFVNAGTLESTEFKAVDQRAGSETIYNQLVKEQKDLKTWLTGSDGDTMESLAAQYAAADIPAGQYALSYVKTLRGEVAAKQGEVDAALRTADKHKAEVDRLVQELATAREAAKEAQEALSAKVAEQQQLYDNNVTAVKAEREELNETYEKSKSDFRAQLREKDGEISGLRSEIAELEGRISSLMRIIESSRPSVPDMTLEHDGRVARVDAGESVVFINLGRDDRIILGQTFEVFDAEIGVQTERNFNGQTVHVGGKATIEVIRFSDDGKSATARIVRQAYGKPIVAGDLISNIVYDRDRKFRIFVSGDFDVDGDGRATAGERDRIVALVQQWGAVAIDSQDMPVDTDFLVVGQEPEFPSKPDDATATEDDWRRYVEQKEKYEKYIELAGAARQLSIPVLTENRFYTLIGYYQR